ncbi:MAG: hypothetical protein IT257_06780, partial [Chitinophagaceae bacterium]|nr:hypothetical protein [Chitinophagaceae bacterium]
MQPVYRIINQQDGLPDNIVYDVKAVSNGLLYIAHQKGLCSFDGNHFVSFYNKSFPYQSVTNIMQTTDGTIWCRSFSGALFYLKNDSLYWDSRVPQGKIFYPATAFQQYIIGCTDDSIIVYNSLSRSVKLKQIPENYAVSGPATVQFSLAASLSGKTKALCSVVVDSLLNIYRFPIHQTKKWMPLFDISSGKYVVVKNALQSNLFAPFPSLFSAQSHPLLHAIAVNNVVVEDSLIWICATDGVYRINLKRLLSQPEHFFSDYNVSYVCKDRSGNYFFSTIGSGVILVPDFNLHQLKDGVSGITCMAGCKQSVYFGNRQGNVYRYDIQTNELQQSLETPVVHPVEFLFYDSIGKALISSASHFTYIQNGRERYDRFVVKDACYLDSNVLLVTNAGLYVIRNSKKFDQIQKLFKLDAVPANIPQVYHSGFYESERVFQVAADVVQNQIVLHSTSGLSVLNYASGQLDKLQSPSSLINDLTWHRGTIYLATKDKGLQVSVNGKFYEVS